VCSSAVKPSDDPRYCNRHCNAEQKGKKTNDHDFSQNSRPRLAPLSKYGHRGPRAHAYVLNEAKHGGQKYSLPPADDKERESPNYCAEDPRSASGKAASGANERGRTNRQKDSNCSEQYLALSKGSGPKSGYACEAA
jgi:hypothetical protein